MGMFDNLIFREEHPSIVCSNNHPLKIFQTKDFDCLLEDYFVKDLILYREQVHDDDSRPNTLEAYNDTIMANIYTDCEKCQSYYTLNRNNSQSWITEHSPWCEFEVFFKNGILESVKTIRVETPEEVKKVILKRAAEQSGYHLLEDNDPILLKFLASGKRNIYV